MESQSSAACSLIDKSFGPYATENCRGGFDFTLLFEEVILSIIPISIILFVVPFRIFYLSHKQRKVVQSRGLLLYSKQLCYLIYGALALALAVRWAMTRSTKSQTSIAAAVITLVGFIALALLSYAEHVKTIRPSLLLNGYLFFSLLFDIARCRTFWLGKTEHTIAGLFTATVTVKVVLLALEAIEKRGILKPGFRDVPFEALAGIYNRSVFWWLNPLFRRGFCKNLGLADLYPLDKHLASTYLQDLLSSAWTKVENRSGNSLFFLTVRTLKWPLLSAVIPRLALTGFNYSQPFLLNRAIDLSQQPVNSDTKNAGYGLIGAYILVYVGIAISMGQSQHLTYRVIAMARGSLISMLYSKTADLSITAADPASSMILMSADIERITTGWQTMHELWANIIEVGLAIYLLERQLGAACAVPIAVAIISMGGSLAATGLVMSRQAMWLEAIERRITATTAMLSAMKGVKMSGLTNVLFATIQDLRREELRISKKFRKLLIWNMGFTYITPIAAPIVTFAVFSVISRDNGSGKSLDTAKLFTSLSLFTLLSEPLQSLIMSLATFMGAVGSFQRIQEFLNTEVRVDKRRLPIEVDRLVHQDDHYIRHGSISEMTEDTRTEKSDPIITPADDYLPSSFDAITVREGEFGWDADKEPLLQSINMVVPREKLTMLVGPVGCGKSTLVKALLGEIPALCGIIDVSSTEIAFCDQTPWHMNGTIQQSIIGVSMLEELWYATVIQACALDEDLRQLSRGDQTSIGSKGISLSGGQSQRIALARALYARKDLIILDDVLSGLDAETENRVFHNLLGRHGVLRKQCTTVLMASSSVKRIPYADHIICLQGDGRISEQGTFKDLNAAEGYVSSFALSPPEWHFEPETPLKLFDEKAKESILVAPEELKPNDDDLSRRTGDIAVYLYYIKAVGWIPTLIFVIAISAFIFCLSFPSIWVKWWATSNAKAPNEKLGYYLGIYGLLGGLAMISLIVSCWQLIITMVPRSGELFHRKLLETVLGAPMSFFSTTDTGITVNRFSQDLMLIDMELPLAALNTFASMATQRPPSSLCLYYLKANDVCMAAFVLCIAQMVLIGVASKYAAISFPIVLVALFFIQKFYLRTSRQLRYLDLEAKSPLYSQFMECLSGLATVRAFGWQQALEDKNRKLLDESQKPFYLLFAVQRWLTLVLDLVVAAIAVLLIVLVTQLRGIISPGFVGVALLNVLLFSQSIKMLLTFWTNLETHIGSIARIKEFTATTSTESLPGGKDTPPPSWPARGAITFRNLSAEYKPGEPVLNNVSFSIEAGQKIGVCGRTGSGKSSLILSIFQMIDHVGGNITIDDIDIERIPREEIRSRIVGVPQDSYLLSGSVRLNADPKRVATDSAIIDALKSVQLWDNIKAKGGLDTDIEKIFLSHGQKQLFCLARAMLRPSTILILDEATSSVDANTDEVMQRVIRERFASHTIIAVAHKLDTILDFDKIALLDEGVLVEFDPPHELLSDTSSAFHKLYYSSYASQDDFDERATLAA
ncbi:ABC transporter [Lachnellula occidentalis]|uniref:ABC transporter n=1 Tax=Lachnellula occidentalis TaxID=215460 RepID=A0A8H8S285_9HELO|nr:ABC transporter [Lachnellula occidentalis]